MARAGSRLAQLIGQYRRTSRPDRHAPTHRDRLRAVSLWLLAGFTLPIAVMGVQWLLWNFIDPDAWFLSFAAVFLSARLGGFRAGASATIICTAAVWFIFMQPHVSWRDLRPQDTRSSVFVFLIMGLVFSYLQKQWNDAQTRALTRERETEQRMWRVVNLSPNGTLVHKDGIIEFANPAAESILGAAKTGGLLGKPLLGFVHPDFREIVTDRVRILTGVQPGPVPVIEERLIRVDGTLIDAEVTAIPLPSAGEDSVLVVFNDITERKNADMQLRESENRFRSLVESISDVIFTLDDRGSCTGVYGQREDDGRAVRISAGKTLTAAFPDSAPAHGSAVLRALAGESVLFEWAHEAPHGVTHYQTSLSPVKDGRYVVGIVGALRDVTEHKKMEEAIERNARLESLGGLAAGIAHDFNNLLAGIFGHLELAAACAENKRTTELLERAGETIDRARKLTGQLLTFARGGAPNVRSAPLFPMATDTIRFALTGSDMQLKQQVAQDLWPAMFDPGQLAQVLENLAINARHASGSGGLVELSAENVVLQPDQVPGTAPGRYVRLCIRDDGVGMAPDTKERVFDPFFSTKQGGIGLGLSTSHSIMKRHGGAVTVDSAPGQGSSFALYLPAGAVAEVQPLGRNSIRQIAAHDSAPILVLEDDPSVLSVLKGFLEALGYLPACSASGPAALEHYQRAKKQRAPFAAAILDLTVPGPMGGLDVAKEIHAADTTMPIFLMTGYSPNIIRQEHPGISAVLQKPFTLEQLSHLLGHYLNHPHAALGPP